METNAYETINYTPVPCVCDGIIVNKIEGSSSEYEVLIYSSPIGEFNGPITCPAIYTGSDCDYKVDDTVKVLLTIMYGGQPVGYKDMMPGTEAYILGKCKGVALFTRSVENPMVPGDESSVRLWNDKSKAGISVDDSGHIRVATNSVVYDYFRSKGYGINKDSKTSFAQNFHRVISNNAPFNVAREHFGMFTGEDEADEAGRVAPILNEIISRRFVPSSQSLDRWVSTCEGAYSPFYGPNNTSKKLSSSKEVLYTKIINNMKNRLTIEAGEAGDSMFLMRLDKVISGEKHLEVGPGVTTAVLGNMLKMRAGVDGSFSLSGASKGIPGSNINGYKIDCSKDGEISIQSSKGVTITTGDGEDGINSFKIGNDGVVEVNCVGGLKVNGANVAMDAFVDWFVEFYAAMFSPVAPGSIPVPNPAALLKLQALKALPGKAGGLTSKGAPVKLPGIITEEDAFTSV